MTVMLSIPVPDSTEFLPGYAASLTWISSCAAPLKPPDLTPDMLKARQESVMKEYAWQKTLSTQSWEHARARVTEELAREGFGVLTEIDVRATLNKKLGVEFRPYVILGACNPGLAHKALEADPKIGALLPCNVVLQARDSGIEVDIANPRAMFEMSGNPELEPVVEDADRRLKKVLERLN